MHWTGNVAVHFAFETAGYVAAVVLYAVQRGRRGDSVPDETRAMVLAGAAAGAMIGTRLLYVLCDPTNNLHNILGGKTVVGGLLGGLIGVEITKKLISVRRSTGNLFVEPLIIAMCIGRIGCFLTGPADHTAGIPTSLPWRIAIADGVRRHPVALYEIAFLIALLPVVRYVRARELAGTGPREGDAFRLFLASYLLFRLLVDFLKPDPPPILLGMSAIQWACIAGLLYYLSVLINDDRHPALPFLRRGRVHLHDVLPQD
ncbi:MAG: phosphatidylglycerol---prolipoprotein diacylglyceryl transferase [Thermoanaerobaculia bacterium]|jgi:prolipoprotein diacylglyceryltransferase|nr:phosphatidylglycerol---prolipoprotein diacylglyceryl transferase [Thermoanaerobaculia bacterium]